MAKGKEKMPEYQESASTAKVSPFSPLAKKQKTVSGRKGGKVKMTAVKICHYYSSSKDEQISEPAAKKKGGSQVEETLQPLFDAMEDRGIATTARLQSQKRFEQPAPER